MKGNEICRAFWPLHELGFIYILNQIFVYEGVKDMKTYLTYTPRYLHFFNP